MFGWNLRARRVPCWTGAAVVVIAALISSCSSSSGSAASGGAGGGGKATVSAAARSAYATATTRPTKIQITTPVGRPIPTGKTISFISCGQPACIQLGHALTEAADVLGWKTVVVNTDGSAQQISAAWHQVASSATDGVVASGYNRVVFESSLQTLKAHHVPVVECCTTDPAGDGITLMLARPGQTAPIPQAWASAVTVDSGGSAQVLYAYVPALASQAPLRTGIHADLPKYCPKCGLTDLAIPLTALGKDASNRIVSALRAHPKIKYLVSSTGGLTVGLPAALKAAGLGDVKILDQAPSLQGYQYIKSGQQFMTVNFPTNESMWQAADAFARVFTGQSAAPDDVAPPYWATLKDNLPATGTYFPTIPDYQSQFRQLWGK